jgi:hypothetical protein
MVRVSGKGNQFVILLGTKDWKKTGRRVGPDILFKGIPPTTRRPPTWLHLLYVPPSPNNTMDRGPSL